MEDKKLYLIDENLRVTLIQIIEAGLHPNVQFGQLTQVVQTLQQMQPVEIKLEDTQE